MKKIVPFLIIASLAVFGCKKKKDKEETKDPKAKAPVAKTMNKVAKKVETKAPKKVGWVEAKGVKPKHERVKCSYGRCKIWVVTKKVKAELEKQKEYKKLWIEFAEKTNDKFFATVANIPWAKKVKLYRSRVTNLQPLEALKDLEEFSISYNNDKKYRKIELDVAALGSLKKLTDVYLYGVKVKNVNALGKVNTLTDVTVASCDNSDISWIAGKKEVVTVDFSYSKVKDIAPLGTLPKLEKVRFNRCEEVSSIAPLASAANLKSLNMEYTKVADLTPLAKSTKLYRLYASNTKVKDLAPLKDIKTLQYLDVIGCKEVADLAPLANLPKLYSLSVSKTAVKDLKPIAKLTKLSSLYIADTAVTDLKPIAKMTTLHTLSIENTKIADLKPLKDLKELWTLYATGSMVADLSPLKGKDKLGTLYINKTKVKNLAPLKGLKKLYYLSLDETDVKDVSIVGTLPALSTLKIRKTKVNKFKGVDKSKSLKYVYVSKKQFKDKDVSALKKANANIKVEIW